MLPQAKVLELQKQLYGDSDDKLGRYTLAARLTDAATMTIRRMKCSLSLSGEEEEERTSFPVSVDIQPGGPPDFAALSPRQQKTFLCRLLCCFCGCNYGDVERGTGGGPWGEEEGQEAHLLQEQKIEQQHC